MNDNDKKRLGLKPWFHERYKTSRETRWANNLRQYGITPQQFEKMWANQKGRCAICGKLADRNVDGRKAKGKLVMGVDHCHTTSKVRGLLCHVNALGIYEKNHERFARYLKERKNGVV